MLQEDDIQTLRQNTQGPAWTSGSLNDQDIVDSPFSTPREREEAQFRRDRDLEEQDRLDQVWLGLIDTCLEAYNDPRRVQVAWRGGWTVLMDGEIVWEL